MVLQELLAPAGSYEVLVIAVNAGADAVYFAGQNYGARAFAKNFTLEEIEKAVNYAHLNSVKVHVTVNTLVNNFEIIDVINYLFKLYQIGVDAVIVQDFGIIQLLKTLIPDLEVHASTQMALSNYTAMKWAYENNIKRIVLPREKSIDDISKIHNQLEKDNMDLELEAFGHGALCYCVSGNCYISSYNSGRSGNRGACAQPCRREYRLKYRGYNIGNGFLLSTHDLATYDNIKAISDAGITSLKLEGRMKSGDYIGTIVNSYRNIIDGNPGDWKKDLHLVFNRQFTNGYIMNDKPGDVLGRGSSGHEGLYIGDITDIDGTKVTIEIKNKEIPVILEKGDGIAFKYNGKIKGIYLEKIIKQDENEIIIDTTRLVKVGTEVFISYSAKTHESLKKFKNETVKSSIPINVTFNFQKDLTASIKVEYYIDDELINFRHKGIARFEEAKNRPITKESIITQLEKTGGTPFYMEKIRSGNTDKNCPSCGAPIVSEICAYCGTRTGLDTAEADMEYPVMECKEAAINFWTIIFPMIFAGAFGIPGLVMLILAALFGEGNLLLVGIPFFIIGAAALFFVLRTVVRYVKVKTHGKRIRAVVYGYMDDKVMLNNRPAQIVKLLIQTPVGPRFILYQLGDTLKVYGINDTIEIMMHRNYFMICKR